MLIKESDFAVVHWAPFFLLKLCYTSQTYSNTSEQAAQYSQIMHENGLFSHRVVSEVGEKVLPSHLLCWNSLWPWDEYFNDEKHKFNYIDLFPLCTFYCTCSILHWRSKKKMPAVDFQHQFETSGDTQRHLNLILRMISFTHPTRAFLLCWYSSSSE